MVDSQKRQIILKLETISDLKKSILFGVLSLLFGLVRFNIGTLEGSSTSLNEVPLLISVLYISNPLFLGLTSLISSLSNPDKSKLIPIFLFHFAALIPYFYLMRSILKRKFGDYLLAVLSVSSVVIYYLFLVAPLMTLSYKLFNITSKSFFDFYEILFKGLYFEFIVSALCILFYHQWYRSNGLLHHHLEQLEGRVAERTAELDTLVKRLQRTNDELSLINETLDRMVLDRTRELENRNTQLTGYAFINSHLLRAPLANIIGLSDALKHEMKEMENRELFEKFQYSCYELDQIIRLLGEFLSEESVYSDYQLNALQSRIVNIAKEIKEMI